MSLVINGHGGGCCGIKHLHSFGNYHTSDGTKEEFILAMLDKVVLGYRPKTNNPFGCSCDGCMRRYNTRAANEKITIDELKEKLLLELDEKRKNWKTAVECVLNGMQYSVWKEPLERCGFKEVFSFKNSNSGHMCHVFYGTTNPVRETKSVESAPKDTEIAV